MGARRLTRRKRRADERGVALILVLGSITLLTVFLTQLQEETSSELAAALSERDALKAEYYARSGVNLARLLISTEPQIRKDVAFIFMMMNPKAKPPQIPVWEFTDLVLGPFNDAVGSQSFLATIGADPLTAKNIGIQGGGRFELTIVDEDSKINLNLAANNSFASSERLGGQLLGLFAPQTNNTLFEGRDGDNQFSDRQAICSALVDWADSEPNANEVQYPCQPFNQNNVTAGAEDNFYQTIGLPYMRKNAAYDSLDEARLVRGMSDDMWATFVDPEPENPKKRLMTVWGQGKINVATANAQTLLTIACGAAPEAELCNDPLQMMAFAQIYTMGKSMTMGLPLLWSARDFTDTMKGGGTLGPLLSGPPFNIKPVVFKDQKSLEGSLTNGSKRFSIYADGIVPGYKRTTKVRIHTVIDIYYAGAVGANGFCTVGGGMACSTPGPAAQSLQGGTTPTPGGAPGSIPAGGAGSGAMTGQPMTADDILKQMNSNPAGTVIYWRVE